MKISVRIASLVLCLTMLAGLCTVYASAAPAVTGASKEVSETIKVGGTDTGIVLTQMLLDKGTKYSTADAGLLNVIRFKPSDKITMAVLNGGSYTWTKGTMGENAVAYNKAHTDGTVIAAINGDPWIVHHTDYDGDGKKETGDSVKHVSVSRGTMIIEGELWASHQINDENNLARTDNAERGTPASRGPVFAIKNDGTAMIGIPTIGVKLVNATADVTVNADGVNRLPAPNSIILYNHRCGTESFAYEDAYELYLDCSDAAFSLSKPTSGKVVAIFENGDTDARPAITEKTVVISARGNSISRIKGKFKVGDTVDVNCSVVADAYTTSQRTAWSEVKEAMAGFFTLMSKGTLTGQPGNNTHYPTSILGLTQDGTVVMVSTTATVDGTRNACKMTDLPSLCKELGFYTAILMDGGGSTTMVTLSGDKYVRRTAAVDGNNSVRSVIHGMGIVYKGVDAEPANNETKNTAYLEGLGLSAPEPPDTDGADLKVSPSYAYGYLAQVENINGTAYDDLIGMRDPGYLSSWTAEQKAASIMPAILPEIELSADGTLILSGWAQVNGGQATHYWSLDKEHWYACADGVFSDAEKEIVDRATTEGGMKLPSATNGRYENLTVDLSDEEGDTFTVYLAVAASGNREKLCHYLTIEKVTRPEEPTEAPTEEPTDEVTEEITEEVTEEITEAPTAPSAESETEAGGQGCGSALGVSAAALLCAMAAAVALKKKD